MISLTDISVKITREMEIHMKTQLEQIGTSSTGLKENIAAFLAMLLAPVTSIIFLIIEKDSKFVKFYAMQTTLLSIAMPILSFLCGFIPVIGIPIRYALPALSGVIYIIFIFKTLQGKYALLPILGQYSYNYSEQ